MARLSWEARAYILAIKAFAVGLWIASLVSSFDATVAALGLDALIFVLATAGSEFMAVSMPRGGWLSISTIPHVALPLLFPAPVAMAVSAVAILGHQIYTREPWYKTGFNVASYALAVGVSATALTLTGNQPRAVVQGDNWDHAGVLVAVAVLYYVLNNLLIYIVVSLTEGRSLRSVIVGNGWYTTMPEVSMIVAGELLAVLWVSRPVWSLAIVLPAVITHRTLGYMRRLQTETEQAVVALADTIDNRDSYTFHHSRRVAAYAEAIAGELGLDANDVDVIVSAARVHDLGKIGIPDAILLKPGDLTHDETATMWSHPGAGAEILGQFHLFREGTRLARHHHEWYDGRGYPDGVAGDDIPLGARILAVADAYDAMTSDRPYRRALQREEAVERLKAGQGSQFDPLVVGAMIKVLARGELAVEPHPEVPRRSGGTALEAEPSAALASCPASCPRDPSPPSAMKAAATGRRDEPVGYSL